MSFSSTHHHLWRLYPPPKHRIVATPPLSPTSSSPKEANHTTSSSKLNYTPSVNDDVYIRPKSVEEIGIVGRIIDVVVSDGECVTSNTTATTTDGDGDGDGADTKRSSSTHRNKKRKVEGVRVRIQQHCFKRLNNGVCVCDTTNYRQLATSHLRHGDSVLEIGCSTGECTALILRRLVLFHLHEMRQQKQQQQQQQQPNDEVVTTPKGRVVGFDTGGDMIQQTQQRLHAELEHLLPKDTSVQLNASEAYSQLINLHKVDAFADPKGAHSMAVGSSNTSPDVILIDIGGNRELKGVVNMIHWVQTAFMQQPARVIIVKSESLVEKLEQHTVKDKGNAILNINTKPQVLKDGVVENGQEWLTLLHSSYKADTLLLTASAENTSSGQLPPKYSHPLKAPLVLSPKDDQTPICRFHNYGKHGCKRISNNNENEKCPFDHEHCHWCRNVGHVALSCSGTD
ncbi:predicted protein [Thalassiosira pseudonana CCMP1335]|uniref:Uncharacterized protein n=1 Tax=Thalassiosira pseudonana TaxID=35128 RepID=B8BWX1_THAPS|nr:predicted protein [Thalassiosira pseudonana CCMP1335]EED94104.1 predicted protein [Thalassiosira pseudonana CCMP1335]